jgi:adenylate cyclase
MTDGRDDAELEAATRVLLPFLGEDEARFTVEDVARFSGLDPESLLGFWRALGFPDPRPGEQLFSDSDVEMLANLVGLVGDIAVDPDVSRQFARVIGSSLDRIAAAQIDAWLRGAADQSGSGMSDEQSTKRSLDVAALLPHVLELVLRRRLVVEARRRLTRAGSDDAETILCVGFADLVGFTSQTQQLDSAALAEVVGRFEAIAYDVIPGFGGRVVKTIGDEVMFVNDDIRDGCRTALELARRYRDDEALSDVRVGLAYGPVLERDGDVYGQIVNMASRIVSVAYPGSVVISSELHDDVADDDEFMFTSLRTHYLKDIGRVPLWRMRFAGDTLEQSYRSARIDRSERRRVLQTRWGDRNREFAERGGDAFATALVNEVDSLPGRLPAVLSGTATPEDLAGLIEEPTVDELDALAEVVLEADIDADLRVDLLTEIGAATTLRDLEVEADEKAAQADLHAERELRRIEQETARELDAIEADHRARVAGAIARATDASRRIDEEASRRVDQVVAETEHKAEQATRDARARARRSARQRAQRQRRGRS